MYQNFFFQIQNCDVFNIFSFMYLNNTTVKALFINICLNCFFLRINSIMYNNISKGMSTIKATEAIEVL